VTVDFEVHCLLRDSEVTHPIVTCAVDDVRGRQRSCKNSKQLLPQRDMLGVCMLVTNMKVKISQDIWYHCTYVTARCILKEVHKYVMLSIEYNLNFMQLV